jgi:hypothetical protein
MVGWRRPGFVVRTAWLYAAKLVRLEQARPGLWVMKN